MINQPATWVPPFMETSKLRAGHSTWTQVPQCHVWRERTRSTSGSWHGSLLRSVLDAVISCFQMVWTGQFKVHSLKFGYNGHQCDKPNAINQLKPALKKNTIFLGGLFPSPNGRFMALGVNPTLYNIINNDNPIIFPLYHHYWWDNSPLLAFGFTTLKKHVHDND